MLERFNHRLRRIQRRTDSYRNSTLRVIDDTKFKSANWNPGRLKFTVLTVFTTLTVPDGTPAVVTVAGR